MKIEIVGNRGYGIDYGICNIFNTCIQYPCTIQTLGDILYNILNHLPFEDCNIKIIHD